MRGRCARFACLGDFAHLVPAASTARPREIAAKEQVVASTGSRSSNAFTVGRPSRRALLRRDGRCSDDRQHTLAPCRWAPSRPDRLAEELNANDGPRSTWRSADSSVKTVVHCGGSNSAHGKRTVRTFAPPWTAPLNAGATTVTASWLARRSPTLRPRLTPVVSEWTTTRRGSPMSSPIVDLVESTRL